MTVGAAALEALKVAAKRHENACPLCFHGRTCETGKALTARWKEEARGRTATR